MGVTVVGEQAGVDHPAVRPGHGERPRPADIAAAAPIYPSYGGAARSLANQFLATRLEKGFFQTALRFFYGFLRQTSGNGEAESDSPGPHADEEPTATVHGH